MSGSKLLELKPPRPSQREVTVYVKGFLSRGEEPDHFAAWLACHEALEATHDWGSHAIGYHWASGRLGKLPAAAGLAKGAVDVVRITRSLRRAALLSNLGAVVGEQLLWASLVFVRQYRTATRNASNLAQEQAEHLRQLAAGGARVRVVAHSLGCRQVIEAVAHLPFEERPHEIHLCAPAVREDDVSDKLPGLARETTYLYYTEKDRVLDLGFTVLARGRALGLQGPRDAYDGLVPRDASEHFDFWVHGDYKHRFPRLVPRDGLVSGPGDSGGVSA